MLYAQSPETDHDGTEQEPCSLRLHSAAALWASSIEVPSVPSGLLAVWTDILKLG